MKRKRLTKTPVCPQEHLVIINNTTGLSFALERIGPLAAIIIVFYLLVLYLLALSNTPENLFASIYNESLIKIACQHLLLLVGFDTLIYRKYYDTPPILVGHQLAMSHGKEVDWDKVSSSKAKDEDGKDMVMKASLDEAKKYSLKMTALIILDDAPLASVAPSYSVVPAATTTHVEVE
jgi:hypothetical protein